ncbi:hypothetical protein [Mycobacteroides franklinii]|uniref:hypothetical protein n=1 Tax=Mycobacteroides franklinii TaxID=948102 RepID=UPI0012FF97C8|nr:hypothetical protein [Mycobacteroides franklinii]
MTADDVADGTAHVRPPRYGAITSKGTNRMADADNSNDLRAERTPEALADPAADL